MGQIVIHAGMPKAGSSSVQHWLKENHPRFATREHLVPRKLGGLGYIKGMYTGDPRQVANYVLACKECNRMRGTDLFRPIHPKMVEQIPKANRLALKLARKRFRMEHDV